MNANQINGTVKDIDGKGQEAASKIVRSDKEQNENLAKQVGGKVQKASGDMQDTAKDVADKASQKR